MPRRKQECPKRRDFLQDEEDDSKGVRGPKTVKEESEKEKEETCPPDPVPLDLTTKPKASAPKRVYTDYSVDNNLKSPAKKTRPALAPVGVLSPALFSAATTLLNHPFPFHPSTFGIPHQPSVSGILPLRLPTCPATSGPSKLPGSLSTLPKAKECSSDSLNALSSLVQTVGTKSVSGTGPKSNGVLNTEDASPSSSKTVLPEPTGNNTGMTMQDLWWKYMKKEESAEIKRVNEAKQIFTCLQCHQSFQSMDQLVKHMEVSQHFTNVPKHYSWSLQYARQKMRQMKLKLKYSERMMYFCHLCVAPFTMAVHQHFAEVHDMHNPVDNMNFVQIVMANDSGTPRLKSPSERSSSSLLDRRTPTPTSLSGSSQSSSPVMSPKAPASGHSVDIFKDLIPSKKSKLHLGEGKNSKKHAAEEESTDNLLKKMEQLVKNAVDQTYDKGKKTAVPAEEDVFPLPASNFSVFHLSKVTKK